MQVLKKSLALSLSTFFIFSTAHAQESHVLGPEQLQGILEQHVKQNESDRDEIRSMLRQEPVRRIADRVGLDLERAENAVATLDGEDLEELAAQAHYVNNRLAGGQGRGVPMRSSFGAKEAILILVVTVGVIFLLTRI